MKLADVIKGVVFSVGLDLDITIQEVLRELGVEPVIYHVLRQGMVASPVRSLLR